MEPSFSLENFQLLNDVDGTLGTSGNVFKQDLLTIELYLLVGIENSFEQKN